MTDTTKDDDKASKKNPNGNKDKYKRLRDLGDERYAVIENQLRSGINPTAVTRLIQQGWGELTEISEKTLMQQLNRFRWEMLASPEIIAKTDRALALPKSLAYKQQLHVLAEMERLAMLQKRRIDTAVALEEKKKNQAKQTTSEIITLMGMLKDIQKARFDLGLDRYDGPLLQGAKIAHTRTVNNAGEVTDTQYLEIVKGALAQLSNAGLVSDTPGQAYLDEGTTEEYDLGPYDDILDADKDQNETS